MRSRRGIASVVGMVFAIIALTTTITYISYSMGILNNYNQSVLVKNQQLTDVDKEKFQISSVTVPNGKLNITIADTGSLPIQFTKVWIQNTSATDQVYSYVPTHNFVSPGGILTNIGQSMTPINALDSYNVKMVTSRGNTQQFTMNSISSTKLNMQLYAFPSSVPSGFTSQIALVITNNNTGSLVNLTPTATVSPTQPPTAGNPTCTLGAINPTKVDTLLPGGTAVFVWPLAATGTVNQTCTVTVGLSNGQTAQTTVTITLVKLSSSDYASTAGEITIDYTTFRWTQSGEGWNTGWDVSGGPATAFYITMNNNNSTNGGTSLWLSQRALLFFTHADSTNSGTPFYIVGSVDSTQSPPKLTNYSNCSNGDYCQSLPYNIPTKVYFSATKTSPTNPNNFENGDNDYIGFIVLFGRFSNNQYGVGGASYAQTIPFIGLHTH